MFKTGDAAAGVDPAQARARRPAGALRRGAGGLIAAMLAAGAAEAAPTYPASLTHDAIVAWLGQETDLKPDDVIAVTPMAITGIVNRTAGGAGVTDVLLRAQAVSPEAANRGGVLAWEMLLKVDCRNGQVRLGATTGYTGRRAGADSFVLAPAEAVWKRPQPQTTLQNAWRAVCDSTFQPPLRTAGPRVAEAPAKPAAAAPSAPAKPARAPTSPPAKAVLATAGAKPPAPPANAPAKPGLAKASASSEMVAVSLLPNPALRGPVAPPAPRASHAAAQIVSSPVEADSKGALKRARGRFSDAFAGLDARVEPAQVGGRTVYRGMVVGFATHTQAQAFCQTLKRGGQACMAR